MAAEFQDRMLDVLMPAKLKIKEEPAIVDDVLLADGSKAAARLTAVRTQTSAVAEAGAPNDDTPDWRGTCAICLDLLPVDGARQTFNTCCCKRLCSGCSDKCEEYDARCPLCRTPAHTSAAESLRRLQKHLDKGNAEAQIMLGDKYRFGDMAVKKNSKRAFEFYERAAAQGHAVAQNLLGSCYGQGDGVKIDDEAAVLWFRRSAEQGYPGAQFNIGCMLRNGRGVAQSHAEAAKWWRLAAGQGRGSALRPRRVLRKRPGRAARLRRGAALLQACRGAGSPHRRGDGRQARCNSRPRAAPLNSRNELVPRADAGPSSSPAQGRCRLPQRLAATLVVPTNQVQPFN
jgi:TPR repeat protein